MVCNWQLIYKLSFSKFKILVRLPLFVSMARSNRNNLQILYKATAKKGACTKIYFSTTDPPSMLILKTNSSGL